MMLRSLHTRPRRRLAGLCLLATLSAAVAVQAEDRHADLYDAGLKALEDGLHPMAEGYFQQYLRRADREEQPKARLGLAQAWLLQGRHGEALPLLSTLLAEAQGGPLDTACRYWKARCELAAGKAAEALETLSRLPDADSGDALVPGAERLRIQALIALGRRAEALHAFSSFRDRYPSSPLLPAHLLEWALFLVAEGRGAEASGLLQELLTRFPAAEEAWLAQLRLAVISQDAGELDAALTLYASVAANEAAPADTRAEACLAQARVLERLNRLDEALKTLEALDPSARLPDQRRDARIGRGRILIQQGREEEGLALVQESLAGWSDEAKASQVLLSVADLLLANGSYERALAQYQRVLEAFAVEEGRAQAQEGRGWSLAGLDRHPEAAAAFESALALAKTGPDRERIAFKVADAHFDAGLHAQAMSNYTAFVQSYPDSTLAPQARIQTGECLARLGRSGEAEAAFLAVENSGADAELVGEAMIRRARLKESLSDWAAAQQIYAEVMRRFPHSPIVARALHSHGLLLYRQGAFYEALADFERVGGEFPDSEFAEHALCMSSWCHYMLGRTSEAMVLADDFIVRFPQSAWASHLLFWIAEHEFNAGNFEAAEKRFADLAAAYPADALADDALFWAGRAAALRKDYNRALEHFKALIQSYPAGNKVAEARFAQGDVLSELGEFAAAILAFHEIVQNHPDSYLASQALGRKGDCQFTLGARNPERYREAIISYREIVEDGALPMDLRLQAEYKLGRCHEKIEERDKALEHYMEVVYRYVQEREAQRPVGGLWFSRAAFAAASLLEADKKWQEAANVYRRVIEAEVASSNDAQQRLQRLRFENWRSFL